MKDLNSLKVFDAVLTTGSVADAAKKLGISSPAISQALNKLREQYSDPLFIKDGRGIKATKFANELHEEIKEPLAILLNSSDLHKSFDPLTSNRVFKIATHTDFDLLFFSTLYSKKHRFAILYGKTIL